RRAGFGVVVWSTDVVDGASVLNRSAPRSPLEHAVASNITAALTLAATIQPDRAPLTNRDGTPRSSPACQTPRSIAGEGCMATETGSPRRASSTVLMTLAAGQFLMTLDTSVMNVSIATVAKDVGTDVTGIQTAITLYTLVMASLMITGGKLGSMIGRRRAFAIGCVSHSCGSLTTALSPSLPVLLFGWSFLEGVGAALVMPAIVSLVASNFVKAERPRAYGIVTAGGAIAVAVGPLIGGLFTTYWSWRYVFVGEVLIIGVVLLLNRRTADTP